MKRSRYRGLIDHVSHMVRLPPERVVSYAHLPPAIADLCYERDEALAAHPHEVGLRQFYDEQIGSLESAAQRCRDGDWDGMGSGNE